jgi:hypothetical protein
VDKEANFMSNNLIPYLFVKIIRNKVNWANLVFNMSFMPIGISNRRVILLLASVKRNNENNSIYASRIS